MLALWLCVGRWGGGPVGVEGGASGASGHGLSGLVCRAARCVLHAGYCVERHVGRADEVGGSVRWLRVLADASGRRWAKAIKWTGSLCPVRC